ncbi:Zn-dependent hydrolase [Natrinema sp. LN54]|uniref:Zn-dependent hydrolase n=1 Tax=Natrinema sp. LN54 TaxID=3458705 RepID=UPI004034F8F4
MEIVRERLREDILETAAFGKLGVETGHGRTVLTGSEADQAAREYFVERLESAGLTVRIDPVGNIAGRWVPDGVDPDVEPVAMGSHLDSVPQGGIFDGPLGVYGALEAVRAVQDADITPERPLEVVSFTEEEGGRFGIGTLGSSVATGSRPLEDVLELEDDEGWTLADRLSSIDFDGDETIDPTGWNAWLELHIEQATRLESTGSDVGIVDSITGITNCSADVRGEADHAGATPMDDRTDALVAAAEFVQAVEEIASDIATEHPAAVATVGRQTIEPNVRNIVPGRVNVELDIRDVEHETMDALVDRFRQRLERIAERRSVETTFDRFRDDPPSHMSDRCTTAAVDAADRCGATAKRLHSAAMHDTANVSDVTDAGLLFAPSKDGVSHNPKEWTDWDDCATATRVLAETAAQLATSSAE